MVSFPRSAKYIERKRIATTVQITVVGAHENSGTETQRINGQIGTK